MNIKLEVAPKGLDDLNYRVSVQTLVPKAFPDSHSSLKVVVATDTKGGFENYITPPCEIYSCASEFPDPAQPLDVVKAAPGETLFVEVSEQRRTIYLIKGKLEAKGKKKVPAPGLTVEVRGQKVNAYFGHLYDYSKVRGYSCHLWLEVDGVFAPVPLQIEGPEQIEAFIHEYTRLIISDNSLTDMRYGLYRLYTGEKYQNDLPKGSVRLEDFDALNNAINAHAVKVGECYLAVLLGWSEFLATKEKAVSLWDFFNPRKRPTKLQDAYAQIFPGREIDL